MAFLGIRINHDIGRLLSNIKIPGDKENVSDYHITLLCFEDNLPISEISQALEATYDIISDIKPFLVQIDSVSCFPKRENKPCPIVTRVKSDELHDLRDKLAKEFDKNKIDYSKVFKDFKPHITLAYHNEEIEEFKFDKLEFSVSEIVLWGGDNGDDRVFITFPLKGPEKKSYLINKIDNFYKSAEDLPMTRTYALNVLELKPNFDSKDLLKNMKKKVLENKINHTELHNSPKLREIIKAYKFLRNETSNLVIHDSAKEKSSDPTEPPKRIRTEPPWGDWYNKYINSLK